jgi:vacuolar-type H+-ATPase subunit I/STV1
LTDGSQVHQHDVTDRKGFKNMPREGKPERKNKAERIDKGARKDKPARKDRGPKQRLSYINIRITEIREEMTRLNDERKTLREQVAKQRAAEPPDAEADDLDDV